MADRESTLASLKGRLLHHANAFLQFNKSKTQRLLEQCSEQQEDAYYLIEYILQTSHIALFEVSKDERAPSGIIKFQINGDIKKRVEKYFPRDLINLRASDPEPSIVFLSLMGSVGTMAFNKKSDFDYWVCHRDGLSKERLGLLRQKCQRLEQWCEAELGVEVHFFMMTPKGLVADEFGEVSKESCGSAQAKLLKEEYFRSSIHVAGRVPLWWIAPRRVSSKGYQQLAQLIETKPDFYSELPVDTGDLGKIHQSEFLGAGLWQLNKGVSSPYKSVLKLALILEYSERVDAPWMAEDLKGLIHEQPLTHQGFDSYHHMMLRVLRHFSSGSKEELETLRECFFLKIGVEVSSWYNGQREPPDLSQRLMLNLVREWAWTREKVMHLERVNEHTFKQTLALKERLESFMLKGLGRLFSIVEGDELESVMSNRDQTKLINRLLAIYDNTRDRVSWLYPPYDSKVQHRSFTIAKAVGGGYHLYKDEMDLRNLSSLEEKFFLKASDQLEQLMLWMIYNGLIEAKTIVKSNFPNHGAWVHNLKQFSYLFRDYFGRAKIPPLDGPFDQPPYVNAWIWCLQLTPHDERSEGTPLHLDEATHYLPMFSRRAKASLLSSSSSMHTQESPSKKLSRVIERLDHKDAGEGREAVEFTSPSSVDVKNQERMLLHPSEDVLNAWNEKKNLCERLHLVSHNSWGEVAIENTHGGEGLVRGLSQMIQEMMIFDKDPSQCLRIFVGRHDLDSKMIKSRLGGLVLQVWEHFQAYRSENVLSCFLFEVAGELFAICFRDGKCFYQSYSSLSHATLSIRMEEEGAVRYAFDQGQPRWNFYQQAIKKCALGERKQFFQKGTKDGYYMLCDEFGHLVISTISRDDFRAVLPKVAAGVDAVTLLGEKSKDVSMVTSYWFQRADSGEPSFVEVSEKVEKSIQAALPRASELEMVLPKSSCDHFLKEYVKNVHFSFDSDASRHELQFVVSELKKLRGDQKKGYPIFISSLDVVGQDFSKHWSLALKVHLKQLLELACLKLYRRKK